MKASRSAPSARRGFTLIELTVVIFILVALLSMGFGMSGAIEKWKKGKEASETLRSIYTAQRLYMADHPMATIASLNQAMLLPYIPNGNGANFPTSVSLTGATLYANVRLSPPVWTLTAGGAGDTYDPSGNARDALWDVGE